MLPSYPNYQSKLPLQGSRAIQGAMHDLLLVFKVSGQLNKNSK